MKLFNNVGVAFALLLCGTLASTNEYAQTKYQEKGNVKIVIEGTSNIHDWDMTSEKGICTAVFNVNNTGSLTSISSLNFSLPAESLKSEHTAMDKNTYKALHTNTYPTITFTGTSASVKPDGADGYILTTRGNLVISGVTKDVVLVAKGVVNADKSMTYSGSYELKMTDYNVTPPSIMLGAIKTGNKLVVKFNLVLKEI